MSRKLIQLVPVLAALLLASAASFAEHPSAAEEQSPALNGLTIPAVAGLPFTATAVIEFEREAPEGYIETYRTINLIGRDSMGRTHNEKRQFMPESFHGSPPVLTVRLTDPQTKVETIYDPTVRVARRQRIPVTPKVSDVADPHVRTEDLGVSMMNGVKARGTRRTRLLSRWESGTGEKIEVQDEEWYSDELHLTLLDRHIDPRFGTQTVGVSNLKREEPAATMFEVPAGYRILNDVPGAEPATLAPAAKPDADRPE